MNKGLREILITAKIIVDITKTNLKLCFGGNKMSDVKNGKAPAVLSYFLVGILWWLLDDKLKKNAFVKFHVKQALVLLIASVAVSVAGWVLIFIPVIGWISFAVLIIGIFILWLMGILKAVNGKTEEIPLIGSFAKNFKF
tara:strand:- start:90 stop:509 length:420 start_codon:yes stop_codon:yes gene_type:complete